MICTYYVAVVDEDKLVCELKYISSIPFLPPVGMSIFLAGVDECIVDSVSWDEDATPSLEINFGEWQFVDRKTTEDEIVLAINNGWEKVTY